MQFIEDAMRRDTAGPLWNLQSLLAMALEGGVLSPIRNFEILISYMHVGMCSPEW